MKRMLRLGLCAGGLLLLASLGRSGDAPTLPPLTTIPESPRSPGKFVWADLATHDVEAAQNFYAGLFGWTFRRAGNYHIAYNDERPLAGLFQRPRAAQSAEAKPRWFGYISVSSVDKAQRAVIKGGGSVLAAPQKMPKRGEQAVFADAEGAVFGVVRSAAGDPRDFLAEPGDWIWVQLLSRNPELAAKFYHAVAGYEAIEHTAANRTNDFILASQGYARAAVREIPKARQAEIRPTWLPFVRVQHVKESTAKAEQLGGKVLLPPRAELMRGKVAVIADPTGAAVGLLEWEGPLTKGGE